MASLRLGVLIPTNKKAKIKLPERILKSCEDENIDVVDLSNEEDLYTKGPFDVLLHKVTDYYNELSQAEAAAKIQRVKDYSSRYQKMAIIDNFDGSEKLTDRFYQTKLMKSCEMCVDGIKVFVPKVLEIPKGISVMEVNEIISSNNVKFPILVKPGVASVTEGSHDMRLVFNHENLTDLKLPCVIQEFCNHGGVVYKVYIINGDFYMCERPSIKDVDCQSRDSLYFDTRKISKLEKSFVPDLHGNDPNQRTWMTCDDKPDLLNREVVSALSELIRKSTHLNLLGIDILIESATGNYALIDVNHFPGYSGINEKHFVKSMVQLIKKLGDKK